MHHVCFEFLKLTLMLDWSFTCCTRIHHDRNLGFQSSWFGVSHPRNNWDSRLRPLQSACSHEPETYLAMDLYIKEGYSLFSWIPPNATFLKPWPYACVSERTKKTTSLSLRDWLVWKSAPDRPLTLFFFYIIYVILYIKWNCIAQLARGRACNLQDLGSSPRSGKNPMLFFYNWSHAGLTWKSTIHTQYSLPTRLGDLIKGSD